MIATGAASGTGVGAAVGGLRGAGIGAGVGAAAGVLETLFSRGDEVRLASGTNIEMVIERPVQIDYSRVPAAPTAYRQPVSMIRFQAAPGRVGQGLPLPMPR